MTLSPPNIPKPAVVLITGAAKRLGAATARHLHACGCDIIVHYHQSQAAAEALAAELNASRPDSAITVPANLADSSELTALSEQALNWKGKLDVLINNASAFYPTPLQEATEAQWNHLLNTNIKAPFFLCQHLRPALSKSQGCIVNLVDIYSQRPLNNHPIYSISKAGMAMLTQSLALELAPDIRVNGVSPGAILWPESESATPEAKAAAHDYQQQLLRKIPLERIGTEQDIAQTIQFLAFQAPYVSGQIINIDGGRSIGI
ncbi:pteridine reductase [Oleiphilus messinensis]|uniref:Pteridine reductase n=1 Tax=Oleiphilus messinensis TaxID=141451 RepID=A0A1Y0I5F3_9GAMM|nr:pteridine reductase [Oleiphilus messinensis]ARU55702.1 pteridine reductase [Oleiphilus messinensis]